MSAKNILKIAFALLLIVSVCLSGGCAGNKDDSKDTTTSASQDVDKAPEKDADKWVSAIFGGGPFVHGGENVAKRVKESGFNTMIIWSVHVHEDGTLYLNDVLVCKDGKCVVSDSIKETWANLKEEGSGIKRVEISIGGWDCADFEGIKKRIEADGVGEDTILYKNFKALIDATKADAVNYDDESCYDVISATKFGQMCDAMGVKIALCPYTQINFWKTLKSNLGDIVDRVYVQCYAGGAGNNPDTWAHQLNTKVIPGYWCMAGGGTDSADTVSKKLSSCIDNITGGFMWLYDDMQNLRSPNSTSDYASAINSLNPLNSAS